MLWAGAIKWAGAIEASKTLEVEKALLFMDTMENFILLSAVISNKRSHPSFEKIGTQACFIK